MDFRCYFLIPNDCFTLILWIYDFEYWILNYIYLREIGKILAMNELNFDLMWDSPQIDDLSYHFIGQNSEDYSQNMREAPKETPILTQFSKKQTAIDISMTVTHKSHEQYTSTIGGSEKYANFLMSQKSLPRQNNNFPKMILNRFYQFIKRSNRLVPQQRTELLSYLEGLKKKQFQNSGMRHFQFIFRESTFSEQNRKQLHIFLTKSNFIKEKIIKSKAIKGENRWKYLIGAKLTVVRCRSECLITRFETTRQYIFGQSNESQSDQ